MEREALWIVSIIGSGTLIGVFWKMKNGFGPFNLRVVGIVLIATLAVILGLAKDDNLTAAIGILGAIAGYLFGTKANGDNNSGADISGSTLGDNNRIAGRDINETVNNIQAKVEKLGELIEKSQSAFENFTISSSGSFEPGYDYLINTIYKKDLEESGKEIEHVIRHWEGKNWKLMGMSSDYQGMDGIFLLFKNPTEQGRSKVQVFHSGGSRQIYPENA